MWNKCKLKNKNSKLKIKKKKSINQVALLGRKFPNTSVGGQLAQQIRVRLIHEKMIFPYPLP